MRLFPRTAPDGRCGPLPTDQFFVLGRFWTPPRPRAGASALPRMRAFAGAQTGNLSRRSARRWAERSRKGAPRGWTERRKGKEEGQGGGARSDERPHARTCRKFTTP
ncbi:unnamed protein product [Prorocentrum cordatum]|uniref:Uncharacterized protein n=1 Tax=Prorocentrum cordatum TaxID=2364126 RepID=A0ABN9QRR6_9DINO|nr:unnamed protein product [Polarella glacialis]